MRKRLLSMFLAGVLSVGALAGCSGAGGENGVVTNTTQVPSGTADQASGEGNGREEITLSILCGINKDVAPEHEPVNRLLKEKFNINVEWTDIGSSAIKEQLNLLFSTGQMPEIIWNYNGEDDIKRWATQGYLYSVNDYIDKIPNYRNLFTDEEWNEVMTYASNSDGKVYYIPAKNYRSASQVWMYRMSMLKELGRSVPATTDEFYELLKAYKEAYPEAIPIANRWGFGNFLGGFAQAFRTKQDFFYDPDTENLEYGPVTDKFRDMLKYVSKLYAEGLVDPELQTATDTQWEEVYVNGLNIAEYSYTNRAAWANNIMKNADPDADWQWVENYLTAYPDKGSIVAHELSYQQTSGSLVTKALPEEKLDRWLEVIDWACSEEGQRWFSMGEEGVTYELTDGKPVFLPGIYTVDNPDGKTLEEMGYSWWLKRSTESLEPQGYQDDVTLSEMIAGREYLLTVAYSLSDAEEKSLIDSQTQINDIYQEYALRFLTGSLDPSDDDQWDEYLKRLESAGLGDVLSVRRAAMIVAK